MCPLYEILNTALKSTIDTCITPEPFHQTTLALSRGRRGVLVPDDVTPYILYLEKGLSKSSSDFWSISFKKKSKTLKIVIQAKY